jgi:hypothetical protein
MPYYYKAGEIPPKRHTQFRKADGGLYAEQLFSTEGFSNDYSLLYHLHPPTAILTIEKGTNVAPQVASEHMLGHRSFEGFQIKPVRDFLESRIPVLINNDVHIVLAAPLQSVTDYFYKNADADELIFVHEGNGVLKTMYGEVFFKEGDYLLIPRALRSLRIMIPAIYSSASSALMFLPRLLITMAASSSKSNFFEMVRHARNFTWSLNSVMIGKVKYRILVKFRYHGHIAVSACRFHMLTKGISIPQGSRARYRGQQCDRFNPQMLRLNSPSGNDLIFFLEQRAVVPVPFKQ